MELTKLYIEATQKTPNIDFNSITGELILSGKSIPENAALVYERVLKWVGAYINHRQPHTAKSKLISNISIQLQPSGFQRSFQRSVP